MKNDKKNSSLAAASRKEGIDHLIDGTEQPYKFGPICAKYCHD